MMSLRRPRRAAEDLDVQALAVRRLAEIIERRQRAHAEVTPTDLAEAIVEDAAVGPGLVDTDELGGRHAAVTVWVPVRLPQPLPQPVSDEVTA